jgi:hypothetical protein
MTSEPASATSHVQEPDRDDAGKAAKGPLDYKGFDIASQIRSVQQSEPDLARAVGNYAASVEQTLSVIEAIEETLQHKRRQIDEIQARQKVLAREYRELGESLELATKDLAQQFADIIRDLEADLPIAKPSALAAADADPGNAAANPPAREATETRDAADVPPAGTAPKSDEASGLDLDPLNLPPVPEFLGDRPDPLDQAGRKDSDDSGSGPLGWWRQGKKG